MHKKGIMQIGIYGNGWRKQITEDMLERAGIIAEIKNDLTEELTLVCSIEPGDGKKIADFVKNGGNVVVLYPEREVLCLFGDEMMYTYHFPMLKNQKEELPFSFLQVFPPVSLVRPAGCQVWANFALDFSSDTASKRTSRYPAIAWREFGRGRIGMFFYDLPSSILLLQQGWEFFSSDGDFLMPVTNGVTRASYLAYGLINSSLAHLPQAYFHELYLLSLIRKLAEKHSPIPRIWYYPSFYTTALLVSGDSDGLGRKKLMKAWKKIFDWGGEYTQMIMLYDLKQFRMQEIAEWNRKGIDFGFHYYAGAKPTPGQMRDHLTNARKFFLKKNLEFKICRGHSVIWVGWDEQVKIMEEAGLKLSSNFLDYFRWGATQGLPYPLYTRDGRSRVHELQLFAADDATLLDKSGTVPMKPNEALLKMTGFLDVMGKMYYQPINVLLHPYYFAGGTPDSSEWAEGVIRHAKSNDIPVMNLNQFFSWWTRRCKFLDTPAGSVLQDTKALSHSEEFSVALPEEWNGRKIQSKGKYLRGTGEMLFPLKDAANIKYGR